MIPQKMAKGLELRNFEEKPEVGPHSAKVGNSQQEKPGPSSGRPESKLVIF
jgi:hypothetical protein